MEPRRPLFQETDILLFAVIVRIVSFLFHKERLALLLKELHISSTGFKNTKYLDIRC